MKYKLILILIFCPLLRLMAQKSETITSSNAFSFGLYKQLNKENENLFFSPISIELSMRMLYEGAESKTKSEFEKTLGISSASNNADEMKYILDLMTQTNSSNRLNIANALWIDKKFTVNDNYKEILSSKFNAELIPMNLSNRENSSNAINNWTAQKINNLIQHIIEPSQISNKTKLLLTNAIYFNGKWNNSFDKNLTKKAQFFSTQNNSFLIDFMRIAESLYYWENDAIQYVRKYFKGRDKYICFLLPKKKNGIAELDSLLSKLDLRDIRSSASIENINLAIPKFKMDNEYALNEPLSQIGLKSAFTEHANFDGIAKEPLKIGEVLHKAHFEIDEEEVKAAATTLANMRITGIRTEPKYIDFIADHPFVFFIMDNKTNTILFIGKFVNQGMKEGSLGNADISSVYGNSGADLNKLSLRVKNKPLIVVNGIPYLTNLENFDLQNIHNLIDVPREDIESIEVLIDTASTAKWGSRASNGVISIKTKRDNMKSDLEDVAVTVSKIGDNDFIPVRDRATAVTRTELKGMESVMGTTVEDMLKGRLSGFNIAFGQSSIIRGTITDSKTGEALIQVNVVEMDKNGRNVTGTVTDANGNYTFNVTDVNNDIQVSYIGYTKQIFKVNNRSVIDIKLDAESIGLEDVVEWPLRNVDISAISGDPGADLNIRSGTSSFSLKNNPLIIVNGIPYVVDFENFPYIADRVNFDFQNIHNLINVSREDIETIEILRDSATISKYGAWATNGVIDIKVKDGVIKSVMSDPVADLNINIPSFSVGNNPVIIVNGIRKLADTENFDFTTADRQKYGSLIRISPEDIESIEFLNDTATNISKYGAAAADGVINIKTKKGDMRYVRPVTVEEIMQGPLWNEDIYFVSGDPVAGLNVRIPDKATHNSKNSPLITVNGIPYEADLENFDIWCADIQKFGKLINVSPEDIESIEVLRDAATISKYGAAATYGVLNIKTKGDHR